MKRNISPLCQCNKKNTIYVSSEKNKHTKYLSNRYLNLQHQSSHDQYQSRFVQAGSEFNSIIGHGTMETSWRGQVCDRCHIKFVEVCGPSQTNPLRHRSQITRRSYAIDYTSQIILPSVTSGWTNSSKEGPSANKNVASKEVHCPLPLGPLSALRDSRTSFSW